MGRAVNNVNPTEAAVNVMSNLPRGDRGTLRDVAGSPLQCWRRQDLMRRQCKIETVRKRTYDNLGVSSTGSPGS